MNKNIDENVPRTGLVKNKILYSIGMIFFLVALALGYKLYIEKTNTAMLERKYVEADQKYQSMQKTLIGYTAFTSYTAVLNKTMMEQMKFVGAKINRKYVHFENIEVKKGPIKSNAALELVYDVEYVLGYDLGSRDFQLSADEKGITLKLKKPELVALPSVVESSIKTLVGGILIDEKQESINLLNKLPQISNNSERNQKIAQEEANVALCEKKIKEFIKGILIAQYKIEIIPDIKIIYSN